MKSSVKRYGGLTAFLLGSALGLAACGSDHDGDPAVAVSPPGGTAPPAAGAPPAAPETAVPASAGRSAAAYLAYVRGLKTDETSVPVNIGGFVAPVDDTGAATAL